MFGTTWGSYRTFFLGFVPIVWIAMRQGIRRVVIGALVLNFSIVLAMDLAPPPVELLSKISLFMFVVSSVGLILGSEVSERNRVSLDLHEQSAYLNALIDNSPLGIVVFNQQGRVEFANPAFEKLLLYDRRDLAIGDIATLWLEGVANALPKALAGETCHDTVRQRRKDGKILDLALHAVPLRVKGEVRGIYAIYEDISEQVRAAEAERKFADSQKHLVEELQLRARQMTLLNDLGSHLQGCATLAEASALIAQSSRKLFPDALSGTLYVLKAGEHTLQAAVHFGGAGLSESEFRLDACASLRRGQPNWSDLRDAHMTCYHLPPAAGRHYLCVPVAGRDETFGVLHLEFPEAQSEVPKAETASVKENWLSLAVTVAGQLALSLAAIRLRENLRDQAIRDPLTKLYNRRFLEESLARELERAARGVYPVSLLFFDLDHFKRFNDTFGHAAGDVVLRSIGVLLRSFFRSSDICCRAGGEEFAVILPEAAPESAVVRANALRLEVKAMQLTHQDQPLGCVSISIGVAAFPDHASTPQQLLQVADGCLYRSKARGRNMATLAGSSNSQPAHDSTGSRITP
jgi:diguanylate cyclase (GGDEF)-like protein/PAS domain S-box-containing protein